MPKYIWKESRKFSFLILVQENKYRSFSLSITLYQLCSFSLSSVDKAKLSLQNILNLFNKKFTAKHPWRSFLSYKFRATHIKSQRHGWFSSNYYGNLRNLSCKTLVNTSFWVNNYFKGNMTTTKKLFFFSDSSNTNIFISYSENQSLVWLFYKKSHINSHIKKSQAWMIFPLIMIKMWEICPVKHWLTPLSE